MIEIHIPDSVQMPCEACLSELNNFSRVTFGDSSSLEFIGRNAFQECGLIEIYVPNGVDVLGESCFYKRNFPVLHLVIPLHRS